MCLSPGAPQSTLSGLPSPDSVDVSNPAAVSAAEHQYSGWQKGDTTAYSAALQNNVKKYNVGQGQTAIDNAFSQFNPDYMKNYGQAYENYYNPQIDQQYGLAQEKETYDAARKNTLDSTPAITEQGKLTDAYLSQRQKVASDAAGAVTNLQNNIQTQKQNLYQLNSSAADPTAAASQALSAAGTIPSAPSYSPLGDLFAGLVNSAAGYQAGQNQTLPANYLRQAGAGLPSPQGSGRVVS